jgi:hypothetical protein
LTLDLTIEAATPATRDEELGVRVIPHAHSGSMHV